MNIPFEFSCAYTSPTSVVKLLFSNTDNLILAAIVAAGTAADVAGLYNIVIPTGTHWLESYGITIDAAAKVELGVCAANGSGFVPLYTTFATEAVAGGLVRNLEQTGPLVPHNGSTVNFAMRVTGAASGTIRVAGDVGIMPRS